MKSKKPRMTLEQFLRRLRKLPYKWKIDGDGALRTRRRFRLYTACPISAIQGEGFLEWRSVARSIGLLTSLAERIIGSADSRHSSLKHTLLRKRLLRACKLKETS